jgi:hypothetical protein
VVEVVRSFADPLTGLESASKKPRDNGASVLVLFDQFEEFVILRERPRPTMPS